MARLPPSRAPVTRSAKLRAGGAPARPVEVLVRDRAYRPAEPYAQWFRPYAFWQGLGLDRESLVADPQFVDAARHDYRLAATSPALALGFEPIALSTSLKQPWRWTAYA